MSRTYRIPREEIHLPTAEELAAPQGCHPIDEPMSRGYTHSWSAMRDNPDEVLTCDCGRIRAIFRRDQRGNEELEVLDDDEPLPSLNRGEQASND